MQVIIDSQVIKLLVFERRRQQYSCYSMLAERLFNIHFTTAINEFSKDVFKKRVFEDYEQVSEMKWRIS